MSVKQTYDITSKAGLSIAGYHRVPGATTIQLTPEEAEYELQAGTIVPSGQLNPVPVPEPALKPTDALSTMRNGLPRERPLSDLEGYLLQAGRPVAQAIAAAGSGGPVGLSPIVTSLIFG